MTRVTEFPARLARSTGAGRAIALAALAAATAALGACSAGQITQTAYMASVVPGVNQTFYVTDGKDQSAGSISIRNLAVAYGGPKGYAQGGTAPLQVGVFNDTQVELKVTVTAPGAASSVVFKTGPLTTESPSAAESPSASASADAHASASGTASTKPSGTASASPAEPTPSVTSTAAGGPATFTIPAGGYALLTPQSGRYLALQGLTGNLKPGGLAQSVAFQFQLGGGLRVIETPASPAADASPSPITDSCVFDGGLAVCRAPLTNPLSPLPRATGGGGHE